MNKDSKNIDKLFENSLKGYREKPPVDSWSRMDLALDKRKAGNVIVFWKWMAAAVLILFAFGSGYFYAISNFNDDNITKNKITVDDNIQKPEVVNNNQIEKDSYVAESNDIIISDDNTDLSLRPSVSKSSFVDNNISPQQITPISTSPDKAKIATAEKLNVTSEIIQDTVNTNIGPVHDGESEIALIEPNVDFNDLGLSNEPVIESFFDFDGMPGKQKQNNKLISKWEIGARIAPVQSYREIGFSNDNNISQGAIVESKYNNIEEGLNSYAGGVDVHYQLNDKWSLQSGMYFSRIGQVNNDALAFKQEDSDFVLYKVSTSTGDIEVVFDKVPEDIKRFSDSKDTSELKDLKNISVEQQFELFEVPFMIGYKIGNRKLTFNLSGGLSPAYVMGNSSTLIADEQKYDIGSSSNINSMILNSSFSIGIQYAFTKKLALNFEPTFKYSLNPINNNNRFSYHPYSLSWFTGVRYNF
ncbi:MAG: hypothetical protein DRJ05_05635 [Bacteroidetes bacterium]|nr:MAG: hypothetical protein DRJ05_05635 [Bacteroidota bacterium]